MLLYDGTHLTGFPENELHEFAAEVGLQREWFQGDKKIPHYDVFSKAIHRRILSRLTGVGGKFVKTKELVRTYYELVEG